MTNGGAALDALRRQRPEWSPWLAVVEEILRETTNSRWDAAVPDAADARNHGTPRLSGTTIGVDRRALRRVMDRLIEVASRSESLAMSALGKSLHADVDVLELFRAALRQHDERVAAVAAAARTDADALQAVVALLPLPVLHACQRRWASTLPPSWTEGYCPVCGSWPAFAEVRGIERSRYFRCGRCGGEWYASILHCAYCGTTNHDELLSLVPEKAGASGAVDACRRCKGYVKTFTRLQGCAPGAVMIDDLASVDLDLAAIEQGFTRPSGAGYMLDVAVSDAGPARRFFAWNA